MAGQRRLLIQFAKAPVPGQVKTRLQPVFSAEDACAIHKALVRETASVLSRVPVEHRVLRVAGEADPDFWQPLQDLGFERVAQCSGNLGGRMLTALNQGVMDFDAVVLVGSDCPVLTPGFLEQAFAYLAEGCDLVLGPAEDGGYVLIGSRRPLDAKVFEDVVWGGAQVFSDTCANAERLGYQVGILPVLWDVDRPEDVRRWRLKR